MTNLLGSVPGKVFLLGEYAILAGLPCVVASVGPRFELRDSGTGLGDFHPESPAGKLLAWSEKSMPADARQEVMSWLSTLSFQDPWKGAGGFGASTAQFALLYQALAIRAGWEQGWASAWKLYRELTRKEIEGKSPSGADLIAQYQGGLNWFDPESLTTEDLSAKADFSGLMIFSATGQAGRKVATHTHLESQSAESWKKTAETWGKALQPSLSIGIRAVRGGDLNAVGKSMNEYADALQGLGLEISSTLADRQAFMEIPGVIGAKGAGAMQADAVLVLTDPSAPSTTRHLVKEVARERGLKLVCEGLSREPGLEWNGKGRTQ